MRKAFELWSGVTNLDFEQKASGSVHIEIRFEYKEHGDGDPFDGPGGTLAHAYFPQVNIISPDISQNASRRTLL
jgi:matrix metalloproteinase-14 (membrane-inserted)